jgi:putative phosphoribosyl transferase
MDKNIKEKEIYIPIEGGDEIYGKLTLPANPRGIIIFAHGTGGIKHLRRNRFVARKFQNQGLATLLFDPLTHNEENDDTSKYDIKLLSKRLLIVTDWVLENQLTQDLDIGYFGASTGTAIALIAAANLGDTIKAIVSRGGRPDLAAPYLADVKAPTLFIIGSHDHYLTEQNEEAFKKLGAEPKKLIVSENEKSSWSQEPGKLQEVIDYSKKWFNKFIIKDQLVSY